MIFKLKKGNNPEYFYWLYEMALAFTFYAKAALKAKEYYSAKVFYGWAKYWTNEVFEMIADE